MNTVKAPSGITIPFPVDVPFAMRPNLHMLNPGEKIILNDNLFDDYIAEKKKYYGPAYGDNPNLNLLKLAVKKLKDFDPSFFIDENKDGLVYNLTMSIQDDWVLFAPNKKGILSAQILSVHMPSGWDPKEKANMTFAEIHEPVADNTLIMKAADHIAKTISAKGPYVRHVWAISNTGELSRRPDLVPERKDNNLDELWFRCERQITIPVDGVASLFLIRVYVTPLKEIFKNLDNKKKIIESINSMSDAVLEYKNYWKLKDYLNQHDV